MRCLTFLMIGARHISCLVRCFSMPFPLCIDRVPSAPTCIQGVGYEDVVVGPPRPLLPPRLLRLFVLSIFTPKDVASTSNTGYYIVPQNCAFYDVRIQCYLEYKRQCVCRPTQLELPTNFRWQIKKRASGLYEGRGLPCHIFGHIHS